MLLDNGSTREGVKRNGTLNEAHRYKKIKCIIYIKSIIRNGGHDSM